MANHIHQARPGESDCFVCGVDVLRALRRDAGIKESTKLRHVAVEREYGPDQTVTECAVCIGVEWPCPAIKAITRNQAAKWKREKR
jgi:hypothetical protein